MVGIPKELNRSVRNRRFRSSALCVPFKIRSTRALNAGSIMAGTPKSQCGKQKEKERFEATLSDALSTSSKPLRHLAKTPRPRNYKSPSLTADAGRILQSCGTEGGVPSMTNERMRRK